MSGRPESVCANSPLCRVIGLTSLVRVANDPSPSPGCFNTVIFFMVLPKVAREGSILVL